MKQHYKRSVLCSRHYDYTRSHIVKFSPVKAGRSSLEAHVSLRFLTQHPPVP
ncbi:hypothetical protein [Nostoc sp. UIC 10630]|uniref:hypothetical protein n=1 Tax=Nostoc sp. UIC 10630 TaxID=2100146 RepID=UPI0013D06F7C|nr:hypothetical protein [Nostoc sp. UIC 10630]NEU83150.1 hypothetical protein [Nostoc sp. UIC 10630]